MKRWLPMAALGVLACAPSRNEHDLTVSAAASLTDVFRDALEQWPGPSNPGTSRSTFGASSTLARQIEFGRDVDVFVSANRAWADDVVEHSAPGAAVHVIARNGLVLVQPVAHPPVAGGAELLAGASRWATADPAHVPLGQYAQGWLEGIGEWTGASETLVRAKDARAALRLVERGEVDFGVLYASDAAGSPDVRVVRAIDGVAVEIVAVALATDRPDTDARGLVDWLRAPEQDAFWRAHGFEPAGAR